MKLSNLNSEDFIKIVKMDRELMDYPWSHGCWESSRKDQNYYLFLTRDNDEITAFVLFLYQVDTLHLLKIAVSPSSRNCGVAKSLFVNSLNLLQLKYDKIYLEVRACNDEAINLYHSLGMIEVARRAHYYSDGADALFFIRSS